MVLLHLSHKSNATPTNRVRIELPHAINAQVLTLKKSIVVLQHDANNTFQEHVCYIDLPFVSMYEASSSNSHSWLPLSVDPSKSRTESDYHYRFKAENIPNTFDVYFYRDSNGTPFEFETATNDKLQEVHLWFEYESNITFL